MNSLVYFAMYSSSQSSSSGCIKQFVIKEQSSMDNIPSSLMRKCDLCNESHSFYLQDSYMATTKSQITNLISYFSLNNIETNVEF